MKKRGQPSDEVWSAPESGTVRDDTTANTAAKSGNIAESAESAPAKTADRSRRAGAEKPSANKKR